jgi:hypothetical protein
MDPVAFDTLARAIAQPGTRRRLLGRLLVGVPLLGALAPGREAALAAERPLERLQRRTPQRNRQQRNNRRRNTNTNNNKNQNNNNKNPNKNQNNGPGTGRPLNCPDQKIFCVVPDGGESCSDISRGTLGPLRMCWKFEDGCCPCGDYRTAAHWDEECNKTFPGCGGNCVAANENFLECLSFTNC